MEIGISLALSRLQRAGGDPIAAAALAVIARFGANSHVWLPTLATNWEDSGGTIPAVVGNPVGRVNDPYGAAPVSQATTANKPLLQQTSGRNHWTFDGTTDYLFATSSAISVDTDHSVFVAAQTDTAQADKTMLGFGSSVSSAPLLRLDFGATAGQLRAFWRSDAATPLQHLGPSPGTSPFVWSAREVGTTAVARFNGAQTNTGSAITGTTTLNRTSIGAREVGFAGNFFTGKIYAAVAINGTLSDADMLAIERWIGRMAGVTI